MTLVAERRAHRRAAEIVSGDVLVKACAPNRNERFSTAHEMKDALAPVRNGGR